MNLFNCLSISSCDGRLGKSQNSKPFQHLELSIVSWVAMSENSLQIFDGMVLLQKSQKTLKTFGDILDYILQKLLPVSIRVAFFCN